MYELKPDTTLQNGVYKILKTIGQGGFGITYLAEMTEISATNSDILESKTIQVAVKEFFIKNEHVRNADGRTVYCTDNEEKKLDIDRWKKKFRREADALKSLNSPNVVKVIELFEENSTAYYSMEYIDGCNLYDYVPSGGLKESDSLALIKKVALALKVLHDKNMLHSDLNPKNIMRRSNGEIVLIDFGLTKLFDEDQNPINSSVSIPAAFPGFAPVEQANFDGSFAPTLDIYALGANMYRMLTGEKPQEAGELISNFPSIRRKLTAKGVSEKTVAIVEKAMQPKKTDRFQSVSKFLDALNGKIVSPLPHPPSSNENQKTLERLLNDLIVNKEYKQAYNLCLDYIDAGKCKDYALKRSSEITVLLRKQNNRKSTSQVILMIIISIVATILSIVIAINM